MSRLSRFARRCRYVPLLAALMILCAGVDAEWSGRDGWVEEPGAKSLDIGGAPGHAYLDSASVHRGSDGLVYFNESANVSRPEEIGKTGFMTDAYDCGKNIKYICVGAGNWREDTKSTVHTATDPALPVYRQYLCGDVNLKR
jgi:hypothetical protein